MDHSVRIARLGLNRHNRRARIAFNLRTDRRTLPGGREERLTEKTRADLLTDTLVDWYRLFSGNRWQDEWAESEWKEHVQPLAAGVLLPGEPDENTATAREWRAHLKKLREKLVPIAKILAAQDNVNLSRVWADRWSRDDQEWPPRLRWIRDWIMPRGKAGSEPRIRHVGGLSLVRIGTIRSLYQLQKGYNDRRDPDDSRRDTAEKGDETREGFGRRMLDAMERMRENRVKQLSSRIVEAALGIGIERSITKGNRPRRPAHPIHDCRFAPCHAIVIERLTDYRPDQTRTRRENRGLMSWSAARLKRCLADSCELYGLHLRQVSGSYTSQQDSRTGSPGLRCGDVAVADFVKQSGDLWKRIKKAREDVGFTKGEASVENRILADLYSRWNETRGTWRDEGGCLWTRDNRGQWSQISGNGSQTGNKQTPRPVRIPQRGGEIFVSADPCSPAAKGLQADLNAAANIGLKALLDPDWEARWWYIPCDTERFRPTVKGSAVIDTQVPLRLSDRAGQTTKPKPTLGQGTKKKRNDRRRIRNLWRDPSPIPIRSSGADWLPREEYWHTVRARVVAILRQQAGLGKHA
jgi:IS605 OrfB family transposase